MPDPNLTFYDCRRDSQPPASTLNADLCSRWLRSQGIEYKNILANPDGTLRLNLSGTRIADLSPLTILPLTHLCLALSLSRRYAKEVRPASDRRRTGRHAPHEQTPRARSSPP